mgnify:CR=1
MKKKNGDISPILVANLHFYFDADKSEFRNAIYQSQRRQTVHKKFLE